MLILFGLRGLARTTRYAFSVKLFAQDISGFKQEEKLIDTPHSLNFPARYEYNGRIRDSYINLINPRRGLLIMVGSMVATSLSMARMTARTSWSRHARPTT